MNQELKAIIDLLATLEKAGADALGKKDFSTVTVPDLLPLLTQIPSVVSNFGNLKAEVGALLLPANQQDLEAYVLSKFTGVSAKAQAIIAGVIALVNAGEQFYSALKL